MQVSTPSPVAHANTTRAFAIEPATRLTGLQWVICIAAGIGFAFDLYESLMNTLIIGPFLLNVAGIKPGSSEFNHWVGLFFLVPNAAGGLFGWLGGYLTDVLGRRRVLFFSILLYSCSAAASAFVQSLPLLLFFRCLTMIGVCVEAVAALAWLAELFPHPRQRDSVLGYTQGCYAVGGILVSSAYYFCVAHAKEFPAIYGQHEAWRYTLLSGLIPAIPLIVLRPFLPESPLWRREVPRAATGRPRVAELFGSGLRRETLLATAGMACLIAIPFTALQQTPRIVPGIASVSTLSPEGIERWVSLVFISQEIGSITGRLLFPILLPRIASRRRFLQITLLAALALIPGVFLFGAAHGLLVFAAGMLFAQALFNILHSFWGNYLPGIFPTRIRGTGESFAMNVGGRMVGGCGALVSSQLSTVMPGANPGLRFATACGLTVTVVLVAFLAVSWAMRDPRSEELPT